MTKSKMKSCLKKCLWNLFFSSFLKVVIKANNMTLFLNIWQVFFSTRVKNSAFFPRKSINFELSTISEIFFMSWNHWPLWYNIWLLSWHIFTIWYYWGPFTMTFRTHIKNKYTTAFYYLLIGSWNLHKCHNFSLTNSYRIFFMTIIKKKLYFK